MRPARPISMRLSEEELRQMWCALDVAELRLRRTRMAIKRDGGDLREIEADIGRHRNFKERVMRRLVQAGREQPL